MLKRQAASNSSDSSARRSRAKSSLTRCLEWAWPEVVDGAVVSYPAAISLKNNSLTTSPRRSRRVASLRLCQTVLRVKQASWTLWQVDARLSTLEVCSRSRYIEVLQSIQLTHQVWILTCWVQIWLWLKPWHTLSILVVFTHSMSSVWSSHLASLIVFNAWLERWERVRGIWSNWSWHWPALLELSFSMSHSQAWPEIRVLSSLRS